MRTIALFLFACLLLISCANRNGNYVVYRVDDNNSSDDTIKMVLKSHLMGAKFKVNINDKFASMESSDKMTLYLPLDTTNTESKQYLQTADSHGGHYTMRLKVNGDGTLVYRVELYSSHKNLFTTVQLPGPFYPIGYVNCWLSKADN